MALRGRRQVGCITSAERGLLSTACMCMSAAGTFLPPMIIFPRARLTDNLKQGAPPDSIFRCNSSGWMTIEEFNIWFDHFLLHTRPTADQPVLLLLDGHVSHTKNLVFLEKASAHHVTVVCFPPHCSHRLQPLDVSFMGPLKTSFSKAVEGYMKRNPGKVVTLNEVSGLLGKAFSETCHPSIAVNGFRKTGIVPFNRFVFTDVDFAPSEVTNVLSDDEPSFYGFDEHEIGTFMTMGPGKNVQTPGPDIPTAGTPGPSTSSVFKVSPEMIHPIPKSTTRVVKPGRKRQKAANITASPHRKVLKELQATKDIDQLQKTRKTNAKATSETKPKRGRPRGTQKRPQPIGLQEDLLCHVCGGCFSSSNRGENWHKCYQCLTWFHNCHGTVCPSC